MHLLRMGTIPAGAPVTSCSTEINHRLLPPSHINMKMYRAKRNLTDALEHPLCAYILDNEEDVMAVRDWLLIKEQKKEVLKTKSQEEDNAKQSYESDKRPPGYTPKTKKRSVEKQSSEISPAEKPPVEELP